MDFVAVLAREFSLRPEQVRAVIELLDAGNTVPFIARYRKEATGSLDDQLLRELTERLEYLRSLDKRRMEIEKSLAEQQVLTDELRAALAAAATLAELEDIYRPFRPKRRTRATIARERGLDGLAQALLLQQPIKGTLETLAAPYINNEKDVPDAESALAGARDIIAEAISDDAGRRADRLRRQGGGQRIQHVLLLLRARAARGGSPRVGHQSRRKRGLFEGIPHRAR